METLWMVGVWDWGHRPLLRSCSTANHSSARGASAGASLGTGRGGFAVSLLLVRLFPREVFHFDISQRKIPFLSHDGSFLFKPINHSSNKSPVTESQNISLALGLCQDAPRCCCTHQIPLLLLFSFPLHMPGGC